MPDEPELVIDEAPEDTAAPLVVNPGVTTESVPPLEVPDGFSSSFGDIPDIAEEPAAEPESTAPAAPSSTRISSRKNAGALFDQLTDDCPPEAVAEQADIGALTGAQLACAEVAIGQATTAPELRNELSLALIANAQALRDPSWVGLVERHLTDIDPTNPSLALRLARIRHDEGRMAEALRWSEVALTHRADWPPGVYEPRTLLAHQLYTSSAQSVWHEPALHEGEPRRCRGRARAIGRSRGSLAVLRASHRAARHHRDSSVPDRRRRLPLTSPVRAHPFPTRRATSTWGR